MRNTNTNTATKISSKYLAEAVTKSYIATELKKGRTQEEIKKSFTRELLIDLGKDFCKTYNFQIVD
jgi:hypothetical protein